ncbi:hypothetical protein EZS27_034180, partial [termite gut metagenome]
KLKKENEKGMFFLLRLLQRQFLFHVRKTPK